MKLSLFIAKRYLFSKKSHQVINIISGVAVAGVALATMAMVCTLSVFNGFSGIVEKQFTAFDPQLKITPANGKSLDVTDVRVVDVMKLPQVSVAAQSVEDKAMVQYGGRQVMVTLKGVEENFNELTEIEQVLIGKGSFILSDSVTDYAIPGGGVSSSLNSGIYHVKPYEIYAPKRGKKVNLTNPTSNFNKGVLHSSGLIFATNSSKYDNSYILAPIGFVRNIFDRDDNEASSVELLLKDGADVGRTKETIRKMLGAEYVVQDRFEQQADIFKIMKIEKYISYIFLTFILLVACFNIIGALSMLIIDKRKDVDTLRSLGADNRLTINIFVLEGIIISALGALVGIMIGVIVCLAQQYFGLLSLGDGNFIVESYPVRVELADILAVFVTVAAVGVVTVAIPVRMLAKRLLGNLR